MPARDRNYSAEHQRRNQIARQMGYRSYWERRRYLENLRDALRGGRK